MNGCQPDRPLGYQQLRSPRFAAAPRNHNFQRSPLSDLEVAGSPNPRSGRGLVAKGYVATASWRGDLWYLFGRAVTATTFCFGRLHPAKGAPSATAGSIDSRSKYFHSKIMSYNNALQGKWSTISPCLELGQQPVVGMQHSHIWTIFARQTARQCATT